MSSAIAVINNDFTPDQVKLITETVAKGATKDELNLFLHRCKVLGFDPLKPGQIHFVKYGQGPGSMVVGIDGFRTRAARSGKLCGIRRGVLRDEKGRCTGAWAEVFRTDWQHPARVEVSMAEYSTGKGPWQKFPETMIQKVAEAGALRMAFPDDLGGIYESSEMDQAKPVIGNQLVVPEQPGAEDGVQEEGYVIPYGPLAKQLIHKADPVKLRAYVQEIEAKAKSLNKPVPKWAEELIAHAEPIIAAFENAEAPEPGWDG